MFEHLLTGIGTRLFSNSGASAKLTILMYHRVHASADPFYQGDVDAANFDWQMRSLSKFFNVLPINEAIEKLYADSLPRGAVSVTFDDGFADNLTVALPILKKWNIPATVYIATSYLDGGLMWNDKITETVKRYQGEQLDLTSLGLDRYDVSTTEKKTRAKDAIIAAMKYLPFNEREEKVSTAIKISNVLLPSNVMLTSDQLRQLSEHVDIGAHTSRHPILAKINAIEAENEIVDGKRQLEKIIGRDVIGFAYPNGRPGRDYLSEHVDIVKRAGFHYAVSTAWGSARHSDDRFQLPRIGPWDNTPFKYCARIVKTYLEPQAQHV